MVLVLNLIKKKVIFTDNSSICFTLSLSLSLALTQMHNIKSRKPFSYISKEKKKMFLFFGADYFKLPSVLLCKCCGCLQVCRAADRL